MNTEAPPQDKVMSEEIRIVTVDQSAMEGFLMINFCSLPEKKNFLRFPFYTNFGKAQQFQTLTD